MLELGVSSQEIDEIAGCLEEAAQHFWRVNENGIHTFNVSPSDPVNPHQMLKDKAGYDAHVTEAFIENASEIGIKTFHTYASGSSANCVLYCEDRAGAQYSVRCAPLLEYDHRPHCPLTLQPHKTWRSNEGKIELLPLLPLMHITDGDDSFGLDISLRQVDLFEFSANLKLHDVLEHMISDTAFYSAGASIMLKDIAVLPNGVPLNVDPGQIEQSTTQHGIKASLQKIFARSHTNELPEQLRWFDKSGAWMQDKFFTNPFGTVKRIAPNPL